MTVLAAAAANNSGGSGVGFIVIAVIAIVLFGFIRRANQKRVGVTQQVQNAAVIGSEVMTGSGLYGTVVGQDDEQVLLEIAPGVQVRFAKAAIARVISDDEFGDAEVVEEDPQEAAEVPLEALDEPPTPPHTEPVDDAGEPPGDTTR